MIGASLPLQLTSCDNEGMYWSEGRVAWLLMRRIAAHPAVDKLLEWKDVIRRRASLLWLLTCWQWKDPMRRRASLLQLLTDYSERMQCGKGQVYSGCWQIVTLKGWMRRRAWPLWLLTSCDSDRVSQAEGRVHPACLKVTVVTMKRCKRTKGEIILAVDKRWWMVRVAECNKAKGEFILAVDNDSVRSLENLIVSITGYCHTVITR